MGIEGEVKRERLKGARMARRPPLDDRELLKLLEAGQGQSEAARALDYPTGTVTARVKKLRERGILKPGNVVDWEALETWEREHQPKTYRLESPQDSPQKPVGKPTPKSPRRPTPTPHTLTEDETQALKELVAWWTEQRAHVESPHLPTLERPGQPTPEGPRTRRHILVNDELWERAKREAKRERLSVGDLLNEAIRRYLEGP